jgi:hypothetical protein
MTPKKRGKDFDDLTATVAGQAANPVTAYTPPVVNARTSPTVKRAQSKAIEEPKSKIGIYMSQAQARRFRAAYIRYRAHFLDSTATFSEFLEEAIDATISSLEDEINDGQRFGGEDLKNAVPLKSLAQHQAGLNRRKN